MWVINFNQCSLVEDDEDCIDRMVRAFIYNDPYYPRPDLAASAKLTDSISPAKFITTV
ncbi:hypothetical protein FPSE_02994 [Fusarium pseudograminearum CS3096]|uniref:DUF3669 domain-containing protein n=1 Tax=Fusarium pseudograminearum (strain CS3096) TaxID=1028729 RepID=K3VS71_FUSPC|nr:hypothetical protein FPSE_02994 [Fusarium pseudograminearum CS3096]EKJ76808.1 hypothetical protein FPSE_02994 [Fusarium pseudograminearum CS3096]